MKISDYQFPIETIEELAKDENWPVREAVAKACQGRKDIPLELLERLAKDESRYIRVAAAKACQGRKDIPLELLERLAKDEFWPVREAVANLCQGRKDIPLDLLERLLHDSDNDVRAVAYKSYQSIAPVPVIRRFEPPEKVYKKCRGGVIVEAHIPADAQVRGQPGKKCRASKAIITAVYGGPIGISMYDDDVFYITGETLEIDDFDYSEKECSTGFHFFCTRQEAEEFDG